VLGLGALPTAQAAKITSSTSASAAPAEASATPRSKRAERAAQAEGAQPAPVVSSSPALAPAEPTAAARSRRSRAGKPALGPPPPGPAVGASTGAGGGASAGPGSHRLDREGPAARLRHRQQGARRGETASTLENQPAALSAAESTGASSGAEAFARKGKKGKGKEKSGKGGKEKTKEPVPTPGVTGKGKGDEGAASAPAAEPIAAAASVSVSPAAGVGAATIIAAPPAVTAPAVSGVRAQRAAARRTRHRAAAHAAGKPTAAVAAPAALLAGAGTSAAKPRAPARSEPKHRQGGAAQPALVKTITRIVGVVPTPVRILIAALIALALALAVRSRLSGVRTRRLMRQRGQLLEDVGLLQAALLPTPPERLGPVATSVAYRPADGPGAGGDFYDVFALDDGRLAVIVGDVSGHGREALPHTALVRFTVRAYLEAGLAPRKALQTAGNVLERQLGGSFATVVAAVYHPRERTLTYSSAGHPPPVVLGEGPGAGSAAEAIELTTVCSAPPIGAGMRTGTRETVISVPGPAQLCFHTDGVTEARVGEDLFGDKRLAGALSDLGRHASAAELLDSVAQRTDLRPDDMAACLLRVEDGTGPPAILRELVELDGSSIASGRAERFLRASGMTPPAAAAAIDSVRGELDRRDSAVLELSLGDGPPQILRKNDNVIRAAALTAVGAS
jgi:hypothetical protein